uniref:Tc1-like transposase DDE domain-containing protein n=1 Tax=Oryzias latipes TaxID=8090 RepID=A0A3P9KZJ3_ORYLA
MFMEDNAPPHGARCVTAGLQDAGVAYIGWPAMTPDLNPIDHVWDPLKQGLDDRTAESACRTCGSGGLVDRLRTTS